MGHDFCLIAVRITVKRTISTSYHRTVILRMGNRLLRLLEHPWLYDRHHAGTGPRERVLLHVRHFAGQRHGKDWYALREYPVFPKIRVRAMHSQVRGPARFHLERIACNRGRPTSTKTETNRLDARIDRSEKREARSKSPEPTLR